MYTKPALTGSPGITKITKKKQLRYHKVPVLVKCLVNIQQVLRKTDCNVPEITFLRFFF